MKKLFILMLIALILIAVISIFFTFSCHRVASENVSELKSIPSEYGTLISVTTHAEYPGWAQLWFVDQYSTIRMIRVDFQKEKMIERPIIIRRK